MHDGIDFRAVRRLVGSVLIGLASLAGIASALLSYWDNGDVQHPTEPPERWAPEPRPEVHSQSAMQDYLREKDALLQGYAWVDERKGIARIPLDVAMKTLAGRQSESGALPFPALDSPPVTPEMAHRAGRPTWTPDRAPPMAEPAAQPRLDALPVDVPRAPADHDSPAAASPQAYQQRPGAQLDLAARYLQTNGKEARLGTLMHGQPAILVLGYYHCPMLCSTLMDGVLESVRDIALPASIIAISIDPSEGPDDARRKQDAYASTMKPDAVSRLHLLTATPDRIGVLTSTVGFPYRYDPATRQYGHPAGFMVLTPEGQVSRYFTGVRFEARDVRLALVGASAGKLGTVTDQILLYCSHYDPQRGTYTLAVMRIARGVGMSSLVLLAALILWRKKRQRAQA